MFDDTTRFSWFTCLIATAILSGAASSAAAQENSVWTEQTKLTASEPAKDDRFGAQIAVDGDTAVVSAHLDEAGNRVLAGSVHVFRRADGSWSRQQKLRPSGDARNEFFGSAVDIEGDTLVVGAPKEGEHAGGAVYVFERRDGTWSQAQSLTLSADIGELGDSLDLEGDRLLVGAPYVVTDGRGSGQAYLYTRSGDTWSRQQIFEPFGDGETSLFGSQVALDGQTALVADYGEEVDAEAGAGAAYAYVRRNGSWVDQQRLTASDAADGDNFGTAMALDGDTAVFTAPGDTHHDTDSAGSTYVFTRSNQTWSEQQKLTAPNITEDAYFGGTAILEDDTLVLAQNGANHSGVDYAGAAFVYSRQTDGWSHTRRLTASDAGAGDFFGTGLAIDQQTLLVGADEDSHSGVDKAGSAYVFSPLPDRDGDGVADRDDNCPETANPEQTDADGDGTGDACDDCPDDADKTEPGVCGCGTADTDSDGDGLADCRDACPDEPASADAGAGDGCPAPTPDVGSPSRDTGGTADPDTSSMQPDGSDAAGDTDTTIDTGAPTDEATPTESGCGCGHSPGAPTGAGWLVALLAGLWGLRRSSRTGTAH